MPRPPSRDHITLARRRQQQTFLADTLRLAQHTPFPILNPHTYRQEAEITLSQMLSHSVHNTLQTIAQSHPDARYHSITLTAFTANIRRDYLPGKDQIVIKGIPMGEIPFPNPVSRCLETLRQQHPGQLAYTVLLQHSRTSQPRPGLIFDGLALFPPASDKTP